MIIKKSKCFLVQQSISKSICIFSSHIFKFLQGTSVSHRFSFFPLLWSIPKLLFLSNFCRWVKKKGRLPLMTHIRICVSALSESPTATLSCLTRSLSLLLSAQQQQPSPEVPLHWIFTEAQLLILNNPQWQLWSEEKALSTAASNQ